MKFLRKILTESAHWYPHSLVPILCVNIRSSIEKSPCPESNSLSLANKIDIWISKFMSTKVVRSNYAFISYKNVKWGKKLWNFMLLWHSGIWTNYYFLQFLIDNRDFTTFCCRFIQIRNRWLKLMWAFICYEHSEWYT